MESGYRQLDHTGDIGIEAFAAGEIELFQCCARALFEILADGPGRGEGTERRIRITAPDREILMVRWLRELLYLHDTERLIFRRFQVETGEGTDQDRWLRAIVHGESYDPDRHTILTELKAVTYHQISVSTDPSGTWRARVIFDV